MIKIQFAQDILLFFCILCKWVEMKGCMKETFYLKFWSVMASFHDYQKRKQIDKSLRFLFIFINERDSTLEEH